MKSYNYRMNRVTYGSLLVLLVVAFIIMANVMTRPPAIAEVLAATIVVPRLHDLGRSGWWFLVLIAGEVAAVAFGWPEGTNGILIAAGLYGILATLVLAVLAFIPGQRFENRWGPPPEHGFKFGRKEAGSGT